MMPSISESEEEEEEKKEVEVEGEVEVEEEEKEVMEGEKGGRCGQYKYDEKEIRVWKKG